MSPHLYLETDETLARVETGLGSHPPLRSPRQSQPRGIKKNPKMLEKIKTIILSSLTAPGSMFALSLCPLNQLPGRPVTTRLNFKHIMDQLPGGKPGGKLMKRSRRLPSASQATKFLNETIEAADISRLNGCLL